MALMIHGISPRENVVLKATVLRGDLAMPASGIAIPTQATSRSTLPIGVSVLADHANAFGARSLGPLTDFESHALSFAKVVKRSAFDGRAVEKHVRVTTVADETKSLIRDSFDRAFHNLSPI